MAQISIYNNDPDNVTINVIAGSPPTDQSAALAALQAQLDAANTKIAAARAAAQADKDADNASVAGQGVLNALA